MRLRDIPISAWIGLSGIALAFICAIFAPLIAPYGERDIVAACGSRWAAPTCSAPTISVVTCCRA